MKSATQLKEDLISVCFEVAEDLIPSKYFIHAVYPVDLHVLSLTLQDTFTQNASLIFAPPGCSITATYFNHFQYECRMI